MYCEKSAECDAFMHSETERDGFMLKDFSFDCTPSETQGDHVNMTGYEFFFKDNGKLVPNSTCMIKSDCNYLGISDDEWGSILGASFYLIYCLCMVVSIIRKGPNHD